jgi:hypothetical protein
LVADLGEQMAAFSLTLAKASKPLAASLLIPSAAQSCSIEVLTRLCPRAIHFPQLGGKNTLDTPTEHFYISGSNIG